MPINVTKNQTQQNSFTPVKWAAYGALAGYIAKNQLPVSKTEKEHYQFDQFIIDRKASVKSSVEQELEAVREIIKNGTTDKGYDAYLEYVKIGKDTEARKNFLQRLETLPENAQITFERLKSQVDNKVRELKKSHNFMFDAAVKKCRPTSGYLIVGALLGLGAAFVTYVLSKMTSSQS